MTVDYAQGTNTITDTASNAMVSVGDALSVTVTNDTTAPTVTSFSSTTDNGAYKAGDTINITATMSEETQGGSSFNVTLNTNDIVTLTTNSASNTLTGTYTVGSGDNSSDLTVTSFSVGSVPDLAGNTMVSTTLPTGQNLANNKEIVVDTIAPFSFDSGVYEQNDGNSTIDAGDSLIFTFSEEVGNTSTLEAFFTENETYGSGTTPAEVSWSNGNKTLAVALGVGETYDALTVITLGDVQDLAGNSNSLLFDFIV